MNRVIKLLLLLAAVSAVDIFVLAIAPIGVTALSTAISITAIAGSAWIAVSVGSRILFPEKRNIKLLKEEEMDDSSDYIAALDEQSNKKTFKSHMERALAQIEAIEKKSKTISDILSSYFGQGLTVAKFESTVNGAKKAFYTNIRNIINRIVVFDDDAYLKIKERLATEAEGHDMISLERMSIFEEHLSYINKLLSCNAEILLKLDSLLLEITKLESDGKDLKELPAIEELEKLIEQTKLYK